jgi:hypothetical protein
LAPFTVRVKAKPVAIAAFGEMLVILGVAEGVGVGTGVGLGTGVGVGLGVGLGAGRAPALDPQPVTHTTVVRTSSTAIIKNACPNRFLVVRERAALPPLILVILSSPIPQADFREKALSAISGIHVNP